MTLPLGYAFYKYTFNEKLRENGLFEEEIGSDLIKKFDRIYGEEEKFRKEAYYKKWGREF